MKKMSYLPNYVWRNWGGVKFNLQALVFVLLLNLPGADLFSCNPGSTYNIRLGAGYSIPQITDFNMPYNHFENLNIHIKGELEIDAMTTFKNCNILVDGGASVRVSSGLYVRDNTAFSSCDNTMWYGIALEEGTTKLFNNSSIKHAEYAILLGGRNIIAIDDSDFVDNYIGIFAPGPTNPSLKPFMLVRYITRTKFRTDEGLKAPYDELMNSTADDRGFAGIYLNEVPFFPLGIGSGYSGDNEFIDLHAGIVGNQTSLWIRSSEFSNIKHVEVDEESSDVELDNAISMNGFGGLYFLDQRGQGVLNFSECQRGIYTRHVMDIDVLNNWLYCHFSGNHYL